MAQDDVKNLPPEERIRRLKELEAKRKKEIEEAQKLIKESQEEIKEQQKWLEKVPIPQVAREEVKEMSLEEKEIFKVHRSIREEKPEEEASIPPGKRKSGLEETLGRENFPGQAAPPEDILKLSREPLEQLYQEMKGIRERVEDKGYISATEERRAEYLSSAVETKLEDVHSGRYSLTEEATLAANLTQQMGAWLRGAYQHGSTEGAGEKYRR